MIYKLLVMLAILNRGVTAQYKVGSKDGKDCPGSCKHTCLCGLDPDAEGDDPTRLTCYTSDAPKTPENYLYQTTKDCKDAEGCKCVKEEVVVASTTEKATEPPTTEAPTKMSTEPPTTEAPTKMSTEPPTSGAPAKASTKAPTDAPTKAPTTTTTTTTTTASPGLALPWPKYPGRNCYWKNHGAEEVDYPWGKAVAKVNTLHACQAACVEAADFGCHGVLFQVATGNCYRKKDIVVEKCVRDESVDLYVRPSATVFVDRLE